MIADELTENMDIEDTDNSGTFFDNGIGYP